MKQPKFKVNDHVWFKTESYDCFVIGVNEDGTYTVGNMVYHREEVLYHNVHDYELVIIEDELN